MVGLLNNNKLEVVDLQIDVTSLQVLKTSNIHNGGHRSDVRTLAFSSDNSTILSASGEQAKLWIR